MYPFEKLLAKLNENQKLYSDLLEYLLLNPSTFIDKSKLSKLFSINFATIEKIFNFLETEKIGKRIYQYPFSNENMHPIDHFKFLFNDFNLFDFYKYREDQEGALFEQKFYCLFFLKNNSAIYTYRTKENVEIDFIIDKGNNLLDLIELKKDQFIYAGDFKNMLFFKKESSFNLNLFVLHNGTRDQVDGSVNVIPMNKYINSYL